MSLPFIPSADPASIAFNAFNAALQIAPQLIGRGRREADAIGPTTRQMAAFINSQVVPMLAQPNPDPARVAQMLNALADIWDRYQKFIFQPAFTDGRASDQAFEDWRPYLDGRNADGTPAPAVHPNPPAEMRGRNVPPGGYLGQLRAKLGGNMLGQAPVDTGGFDWNRLVDLGFSAVDRFLPGDTGGGYVVQGPTGPYYYDPSIGGSTTVTAPAPSSIPDWIWPVGIGVAGVVIGSAILPRRRAR